MLIAVPDYCTISRVSGVRSRNSSFSKKSKGRDRSASTIRASLITRSDDFEVGRLFGSYGFMNITSYSTLQTGRDAEYSSEDAERLRVQDVGEGSVKIRLYEGRVAQGPLKGTRVLFKVYPGQRAGGTEADMMATNELNTHSFLQSNLMDVCPNIQILLGGFETTTGEQWLAFRNDGKYSAADYAKAKSEGISKDQALGEQKFWNPYEQELKIKRRRIFVIKLLRGTLSGLAYMHNRDRLHQSIGPASVVLNTTAEREAVYLIPRLRDLAFSVDISYLVNYVMAADHSLMAWRRASAAGAFTPMEKRAFGIADDIYEAGLLFAYLAFVPFCEAGLMDGYPCKDSLKVLSSLISTQLESRLANDKGELEILWVNLTIPSLLKPLKYCLADDRLLEAVKFLDLGNGAGWQLLQAMLNPDHRKRPIAEAVLNHKFMTGDVL
ncbi:hypothetical protein Syun_018129 [Stephania yunnanensis]|uniref:Protein kinase domain-containing protein n=1 Tax=Stephania yunnanensis TaxID=152371 RepID=A0AAP0ITL4_9MAGN